MGVTFYSQIDLINEIISDFTLVNATNIGGPDPNVNISGSFVDAAFALAPGSINVQEASSASVSLLFDIDHDTPPGPVPHNARITKVIMQMQVSAPSAAVNVSLTYPAGAANRGNVTAAAALSALMIPSPVDTSLGTLTGFGASQSNSSVNGNGLQTESASVSPAGINIGFTIDYTTNPGGLYPGGYATYSDFITNFAQIVFGYSGNGTASAQWLTWPGPTLTANGSASGSIAFIINNFSMEVDWFVPLAWTISPSSLTLPNNIVTISRPDPGVPPDQDTQMLQSLTINGQTITPNSPAIIIWTRFLIIIHLTPDLIVSGSPAISGTLVGTSFSGTVSLGTVTITLADLSGIYTFDTTLHHDVLYARTTTSTTVTTQTVAIPAPFFVTAFFNDNEEEIMHYTGVRMRVTGAGTLKRVFQSYDVINTEQLADLAMITATNTLPFALANFIDQNASLRVYTSSTDDFMVVSSLIVYINPIYTGYPQ